MQNPPSNTPGLSVIYLDYDGVLHDDEVYWHQKNGIYIKTPGRVLFEWAPILEELLLPHPDVKIVLATSWVRVKNFEFAKKHLSPNLQERVVGATFHRRQMSKFSYDNQHRGSQVAADVTRRQPLRWFAIDNDDEGWPEQTKDRLIKTEDHLGISCPDVQNAIRRVLADWGNS